MEKEFFLCTVVVYRTHTERDKAAEPNSDKRSRRSIIFAALHGTSGKGGYGKVYKGYCSNGVAVAIKRILARKVFESEIEVSSRVHHKNIVSLVGFCIEQGELLLVYEFMSKGSLRDNLAGNILLDENLNAKVADFVISKMVSEKEKGHVSSQGRGIIAQVESVIVAGTIGYLDPEYYQNKVLSEKSDVYSFGVVMLELITA
ncbi:Leucine-rich repeat protein kinase family protein [Rhynchospora pubera]|uniref:Leucine-rich repeat protein kinase family protein n=1 Tax=Rhynchospora pubera TaxID=906938 RepID=A0AAV8GK64_9POAL|nr:Leucine-rich repeat protein kinase family protein [Rhynchospora pubera]